MLVLPCVIMEGVGNAPFGAGSGSILMDDVQCRATEARLTLCPHGSTHSYSHSQDALVECHCSINLQGALFEHLKVH